MTVDQPRIKILLTGAGSLSCPSIIECFTELDFIDIVLCDADKNALGLHLGYPFHHIPKATEDTFIPKLLDICKKENIRFVFPLVSAELNTLSENSKQFDIINTTVIVPEPFKVEIMNDKGRLYKWIDSINKDNFKGETWIDIPKYKVVNTIEEFVKACYEIGYPFKKVCFKPTKSSGGRGFRIIDNSINEIDILFNQKQNSSITYTEAIRILSQNLYHNKFSELIVTEYLPGDEYSIDCVMLGHSPRMMIPRKRVRVVDGVSVQGEIVNNNEIIEYCCKVLYFLNLHNVIIGLQIKMDEYNKPKLLEINPRIQGSISGNKAAGVNLIRFLLEHLLRMNISKNEKDIKWNTNFIRYWDEKYF